MNSGLQEREANEMIATLYLQDIGATKTPTKDGLYSVTVRQADFGAAIAVLTRAGLPRERFDSIGDIFPDDSVVGTAFEERARFAFALSQELSRTITEIEGVQFARVHIVLPERGRFDDAAPPAKAAVAIYHSRAFVPAVTLPQIKQLVAFGVPNLSYDAVSASLFPAGELTEFSIEQIAPVGIGNAADAAILAPFELPQSDTATLLILAIVLLISAIAALKIIQLVLASLGRLFSNAR